MTRIAARTARGVLIVAGLLGLVLAAGGAWLAKVVHPGFVAVPVIVAVNAALVGLAFVARRNHGRHNDRDGEVFDILHGPTAPLPTIAWTSPPGGRPDKAPAGMAHYPHQPVPYPAWTGDHPTVVLATRGRDASRRSFDPLGEDA